MIFAEQIKNLTLSDKKKEIISVADAYSQFEVDDEAIIIPSPFELVHEKCSNWWVSRNSAVKLSELQREFPLPIVGMYVRFSQQTKPINYNFISCLLISFRFFESFFLH